MTQNTEIEEKEFESSAIAPVPQPSVPEHYVSADEAALFLALHRRTVLKLARMGAIPAHPLGDGPRRIWRFLLSELDSWMRNRVNSRCRPCSPNRREIQ